MVFTRKTILKKTLQGGLETVMEEVNPLSSKHAQPSNARYRNTSNVNVQGEKLDNHHDHVGGDKNSKRKKMMKITSKIDITKTTIVMIKTLRWSECLMSYTKPNKI
uniref:Uncharacterized protein n=1 Tax=Cannabis sativa TaxID=3483 RepID=A0A803PV67_CANSA